MIYILLGMGVFFVLIGQILTVNNARYLLAGYNMMSEAQRQKVDIQAYVPYFRKFHLFLGFSFIVFGLTLHALFGESVSGIFLVVYPLIAYAYFLWSSNQYSGEDQNAPMNRAMAFLLTGLAVFLLVFFAYSLQESKLSLENAKVSFSGLYGAELDVSALESVFRVEELPDLSYRTNGLALGATRKGFFRTGQGEDVKLLVHTEKGPFLEIRQRNGKRIFFSSRKRSVDQVLESFRQTYPDLVR